MTFNCNIPLYLGPLSMLMGSVALTMGAVAWDLLLPSGFRRVFSSIVDVSAAAPESSRRWTWRLLGPLNGTVFVLVGLYMLWGAPLNYGIPNVSGSVPLSSWPGVIPAVLFAGGTGIYNARQLRAWTTRVFYVVGMLAFGFAVGQAAGFHTGPHSTQWFVVAIGAMLFSGVAWFAGKFLARQ